MTNRKAPLEVLEALAEAYLEDRRWNSQASAERLQSAAAAYRAATSPLRTRQEVDAEIGTLLRLSCARGTSSDCLCPESEDEAGNARAMRLRGLCSEPTRDEPEESHQERHERMNAAGMAGSAPCSKQPAAPEPSADNRDALLACARSWEPEVRLLGNVRACTIAKICADAESAEARLAAVRSLIALWRAQADDYANQAEAQDLAPMGPTCSVAVKMCAAELEDELTQSPVTKD